MNLGHIPPQQKIAVVGGGVAGIVSAWLLQKNHRVTVFEKNDYLGGHTNTIKIPRGPDEGLLIDTGFIVLNDATYPLFEKFLQQLGVQTRDSEMSFGFQCHETGQVYAGTSLNGLFAKRTNLFNYKFYRFLYEITQFNKEALKDLNSGEFPKITLGKYLSQKNCSVSLIEQYLFPMAAAIWSTPSVQISDFPAESFLRFFKNHGLLSFKDRPQWKTVEGSSSAYVKEFQSQFKGEIKLNCAVEIIYRENGKIKLCFRDGESQQFDQLVLATHADQTLRLLGDPSPDEWDLFSQWKYQLNRAVLHTDTSILPKNKSAWAAWNFTRRSKDSEGEPVYVTYYMNRLQGLQSHQDYCVTLNREESFPEESVIAEMIYHHPQYNFASLKTQKDLPRLNGQKNSWFCGSYFGYGFHEDAVRSANAIGASFGVSL